MNVSTSWGQKKKDVSKPLADLKCIRERFNLKPVYDKCINWFCTCSGQFW